MWQRVPGAESTLEHEVSEKMEDVRSSFRHKMVGEMGIKRKE